MARPKKSTVDYFPHDTHHGKTMFILENKWGNNGYAAWFKILELLGSTPGHFIDCNNIEAWEFLLAKTHLLSPEMQEILQTLANVEAIDQKLWSYRVIWSDNFISRIADAYKKRLDALPSKKALLEVYARRNGEKGRRKRVNESGSTESKVKESKVNKSKEKESNNIPPKIEDVIAYCKERGNEVNPRKWFDHYKAKGWKIGKTKMVDWKAAIRTWEGDKPAETKKVKQSKFSEKELLDIGGMNLDNFKGKVDDGNSTKVS